MKPLSAWHPRLTQLATVAVPAAILLFAVAEAGRQVVRLALEKHFAIDEFQYAHAAWLVARGEVPYRDFFEVHFPLIYQLLSFVYVTGDDSPERVYWMRALMLGVVALAGAAAWRIQASRGAVLALLGPLTLFSLLPFVRFATEIRPDSLAYACFAASIASLYLERPPRVRAALSGLFLGLAAWGSQKCFVYGAVFVAALSVDLLLHRRRGGRYLLADPGCFVAGAASVGLCVAGYLTLTASWGALWHWCFAWAAEHQQNYPPFGWRSGLLATVPDSAWCYTAAVVGFVVTLRRLIRSGDTAHPDWILVCAVPTTFVSFAFQRAPFAYSMLPFLGVVAAFAARALVELFLAARDGGARSPIGALGLAVVLGLGFVGARTSRRFEELLVPGNRAQLEVLRSIDQLTSPADTSYDNSGSYVSRPHAHFLFYTDAYLRKEKASELTREIPNALREQNAVLVFRDARYRYLPAELRTRIERGYQPYSGDLLLYGRELERGEAKFEARVPGRYFLSPPSAWEQGALEVDGRPVTDRVFELAEGLRRVRYTGPAERYHLLWLPRNGETYEPVRDASPSFSRIF